MPQPIGARDPGSPPRFAPPASPAARGEPQDVGAHGLGVRGREVLELDVGVQSRPDDLELGHSDEPREHRPREVDALHAVQRRAAVRAEQHAAAHLDVVPGDAERVEPPRQVEQADQHEQDAEHREPRHQVEVVGDDEVDRIAAAELLDVDVHVDVFVEPGQEDEDQTIPQIRDHESRDDDEEQSAAEQRGQRMQAVPLAVAERSGAAREATGRVPGAVVPAAGSWSNSFTDPSGVPLRRRRACRAAARRRPA